MNFPMTDIRPKLREWENTTLSEIAEIVMTLEHELEECKGKLQDMIDRVADILVEDRD
jgi:hypothetical protein